MLVLVLSWDAIRLFLHVLAATIWVAGQLTLAVLGPALRRPGAGLPRSAAPADYPALTIGEVHGH